MTVLTTSDDGTVQLLKPLQVCQSRQKSTHFNKTFLNILVWFVVEVDIEFLCVSPTPIFLFFFFF